MRKIRKSERDVFAAAVGNLNAARLNMREFCERRDKTKKYPCRGCPLYRKFMDAHNERYRCFAVVFNDILFSSNLYEVFKQEIRGWK